jgi:hypothetical protein
MIVEPLVKVKPIEGHALNSDRNLHQVRAHIFIENTFTHAEIMAGVSQADHAWLWSISTRGHRISKPSQPSV